MLKLVFLPQYRMVFKSFPFETEETNNQIRCSERFPKLMFQIATC